MRLCVCVGGWVGVGVGGCMYVCVCVCVWVGVCMCACVYIVCVDVSLAPYDWLLPGLKRVYVAQVPPLHGRKRKASLVRSPLFLRGTEAQSPAGK